jgi:cytochrome c556
MKTFLSATIAASISLIIGAAMAADDPIAARKAILKEIGDATKAPAAMLKGEAAFDLATAKKALETYSAGAKKLPALFPDSSKTGDTAALPKVWEDKTRFDGGFAKMGSDAAAANAAITDEASFKANFSKVLGNCKSCHDDFRKKQS